VCGDQQYRADPPSESKYVNVYVGATEQGRAPGDISSWVWRRLGRHLQRRSGRETFQ
jgi:hypothetical protein